MPADEEQLRVGDTHLRGGVHVGRHLPGVQVVALDTLALELGPRRVAELLGLDERTVRRVPAIDVATHDDSGVVDLSDLQLELGLCVEVERRMQLAELSEDVWLGHVAFLEYLQQPVGDLRRPSPRGQPEDHAVARAQSAGSVDHGAIGIDVADRSVVTHRSRPVRDHGGTRPRCRQSPPPCPPLGRPRNRACSRTHRPPSKRMRRTQSSAG